MDHTSRARTMVKRAFGILTSKWSLLKNDKEVYADKGDIIVNVYLFFQNLFRL